jgi:hypothetical protein
MRMAIDIDVDEFSAFSGGPENLVGNPFEIELLGRLRAVDSYDRLRFGELMHLVHAQQAHSDCDDGDEGHPDSRKDGPPD